MQPRSSYLVCATPRSGSTLLCEALTNTGLAGWPKEYFEALRDTGLPRRPKEYFKTLENTDIVELLGTYSRLDDTPVQLATGESYADYLDQVIEAGTTPNGVFGAKVMWGYLDDFIYNLRQIPAYSELAIPDLLSTIFPNLQYVFVTRCDKVRQAVSLWKAIQTWTWKKEEAAHSADEHPPRELLFHFEAIDHLVQQIIEHEANWQRYFDACGVQPYTVVYEELTVAYEEVARDILRYLYIPVPECLMFAERRMKQQADVHSEEWVQHYNRLKEEQKVH